MYLAIGRTQSARHRRLVLASGTFPIFVATWIWNLSVTGAPHHG
jgi:hypothetical protein